MPNSWVRLLKPPQVPVHLLIERCVFLVAESLFEACEVEEPKSVQFFFVRLVLLARELHCFIEDLPLLRVVYEPFAERVGVYLVERQQIDIEQLQSRANLLLLLVGFQCFKQTRPAGNVNFIDIEESILTLGCEYLDSVPAL